MEYIILTGSAIESNRLQHLRWIPSANLVPVTMLAMGGLRGHRGIGDLDLYYTDGALDALVRSASVDGRAWQEWRVLRPMFASVRPYEAWEYLNESTREELEERSRSGLAVLSSQTIIPAAAPTFSYLDLVNFERRHCAAAVRSAAADHLIRVAPGRVVVTEEQALNQVIIRATWTALPAADRKAPEWLAGGLDAKSTAGVV